MDSVVLFDTGGVLKYPLKSRHVRRPTPSATCDGDVQRRCATSRTVTVQSLTELRCIRVRSPASCGASSVISVVCQRDTGPLSVKGVP